MKTEAAGGRSRLTTQSRIFSTDLGNVAQSDVPDNMLAKRNPKRRISAGGPRPQPNAQRRSWPAAKKAK